MARRSDHTREELRELILQAAWKIIEKEGHLNMSARRLASEIGYAPGTIYNLFDSMEDLGLYINARTIDELYGVLSCADCDQNGKSVRDNMKKMASRYMQFARDKNAHWFMLFNSRLPQDKPLEWYKEKIDRLFVPLESLLEPYFPERAKRQMTARMLWSSIHGIYYLNETGVIPLVSQETDPETMSHELIDRFMDGIDKPE